MAQETAFTHQYHVAAEAPQRALRSWRLGALAGLPLTGVATAVAAAQQRRHPGTFRAEVASEVANGCAVAVALLLGRAVTQLAHGEIAEHSVRHMVSDHFVALETQFSQSAAPADVQLRRNFEDFAWLARFGQRPEGSE